MKSFSQLSHLARSSRSSHEADLAATSGTKIELEDAKEWETIVSRTLDLDGIANDGLGYTVTISGPPRQRRKLQKKPGASSVRAMTPQQRKYSVQSMSEHEKPAFEIPVQTELSIQETYHSGPVGRRATFWDPRTPSENGTAVDFETGSGQPDLEFLGNPNMLDDHIDRASKVVTP
jgi:hypothetical protein